jgi:hypothetical protein
MLEALDAHAGMNDEYFVAGDDSWIISDPTPSKRWVLDRDHVETIVWLSHQSLKTMVTVFSRVNGIDLVKIRPENTKLTSEYFNNQVVREIDQRPRGGWWLGGRAHLILHSDNAPVHHDRGVSER